MSPLIPESQRLKQSWERMDQQRLDCYLRVDGQRWDIHPARIELRKQVHEYLATAQIQMPRVLEVGCGSANEFDGLSATGLAPLLTYTGIDISEKNIANALCRYPRVEFRVCDILQSGLPNDSFDLVFVKDMLEHLSVDACYFAIQECVRITRDWFLIAFFNEDRHAESHFISPIRLYHWNRYSRSQLREFAQSLPVSVNIFDLPPDPGQSISRRSVWRLVKQRPIK